MHQSIHTPTHPSTHPSTQLFIYSTCHFTHPSIHPSIKSYHGVKVKAKRFPPRQNSSPPRPLYSSRTSSVTRLRTDTSPFPPRVSPSFRPLGCLFMASLLFCWYSSSMVMAATPFAMAPVILEAAPARPPGGRRFKNMSIRCIS